MSQRINLNGKYYRVADIVDVDWVDRPFPGSLEGIMEAEVFIVTLRGGTILEVEVDGLSQKNYETLLDCIVPGDTE